MSKVMEKIDGILATEDLETKVNNFFKNLLTVLGKNSVTKKIVDTQLKKHGLTFDQAVKILKK